MRRTKNKHTRHCALYDDVGKGECSCNPGVITNSRTYENAPVSRYRMGETDWEYLRSLAFKLDDMGLFAHAEKVRKLAQRLEDSQ